MDSTQKEQVLGVVRHLITFAGGYLVSRGKLSPTDVETIAGIGAALAGVAWSFLAKTKA
jgi:hypothetical protein